MSSRKGEKPTFWVAVVAATAQVGRLLVEFTRWVTGT